MISRQISRHRRQSRPTTRRLYSSVAPKLSGDALRTRFLTFFEQRNHTILPSGSLIPPLGDNSLLFTNAGMVPFKASFLQPDAVPSRLRQAATAQRCMRAGGKHNDLDQVGRTPRHHTLFEMLGMFSFGGYGKDTAAKLAWGFLVDDVGLPPERLRVSVLNGDSETKEVWRKVIGLPEDAIVEMSEKDNFWSMGDVGPCGPCSEIYWDTQRTDVDEEDRWLEIWNLVFMQYNRTQNGELENLPTLCVDTGMGLERLASVVQGVSSNFETDIFTGLTSAINTSITSKSDPNLVRSNIHIENVHNLPAEVIAARVIADHLRAACYLIGDGVIPSNHGRGYVLRRLIRRALKFGRQMGVDQPFLADIVPLVCNLASRGLSNGGAGYDSFPELGSRMAAIQSLISSEESIFIGALRTGLTILETEFANAPLTAVDGGKPSTGVISGDLAFLLFDTHGFPIDLTEMIAREHGWDVDLARFNERCIEAQERSRANKVLSGSSSASSSSTAMQAVFNEWESAAVCPVFTGYASPKELVTPTQSHIVASHFVDGASKYKYWLAISPCPFYGHGGGQACDHGIITTKSGDGSETTWRVTDVRVPYPGGIAIQVEHADGLNYELTDGMHVTASVDTVRRSRLAEHHTATHLLNAALREVLGPSILQAGSSVEPDRLRFDFTHSFVDEYQLRQIEARVNEIAAMDLPVTAQVMPLEQAQNIGAIAAFSEKYGPEVRVLSTGDFSTEFCGGTHVRSTGEVFPFRITGSTAVAAGTRRIEAVAGKACAKMLLEQSHANAELAATVLKCTPAKMGDNVKKMASDFAAANSELKQLKQAMAELPALGPQHVTDDGKVVIEDVGALYDQDLVERRAKSLALKHPNALCVIYSKTRHSIMMAAPASASAKINVGVVMKKVAQQLGGKGGGGKASAFGSVKQLPDSIHELANVITKHL